MKTSKFMLVMMLATSALLAQTSSDSSDAPARRRDGRTYIEKYAKQAAAANANTSTDSQAAAKPTATPASARWSERRDPFVSPLRVNGGDTGSGCSVGKRCLTADEIVLKGVVVTQDRGNIALVENSERRSTVLFLNDQIFHGSVVKITNDSVVLRVIVTDEQGKKTTRDIVKRVTTPAV